MKADAAKKSSTGTARGRGTYATQACTVCRGKKTKCDEIKPVCGPCAASGRQDECSWGKERGRKPRTEAHFEAMRKRADALEEYANFLEAELEKCRREHGGFMGNSSSSYDGPQSSYRQFRPKDAEGMILADEIPEDLGDDAMGGEGDEEDEAFTQELCVPTRNLKLEEGSLFFHGNTAPFRFAPEARPSPVPAVTPMTIAPNTTRFGPSLPQYVLFDDTTPDLDWSRYLPQSTPLDRQEHDKILDLVFKFFTSWCLRIVPELFFQDMHRALSTPLSSTSSVSTSPKTSPKTTHYSPMLHNALIAVGTAYSDNARIRDLKTRQAFAREAKEHLEKECQLPNISVVHALSVLGSFHSGIGEQTLGYLYFGMSARTSQALGLSIDCSAWVQSGLISEHDMFDRNWAHWTIFTQDVCWSLYVGRDFCIPACSSYSSCRIPLPYIDQEFDEKSWSYPPSGISPQPNLLSKTFAKSCELLLVARRIMDVVNGLNNASTRRREVNDRLISDIDLQLNTWKSSLVDTGLDINFKSRPTATPHCLMMHCTYWWFFTLLHRPFYHRRQRPMHSSDRDIDHVKLCKRAAENIISLLTTWRNLYTLRYTPITLVQCAFSAGTIYILVAVQAATGLRVAQETLKHALGQAQICVEYLMEIGKSWQCAIRIAEILRGLVSGQVRAVVERRAGRMQGPGEEDGERGARDGKSPAYSPVRGVRRRRRSPSVSERLRKEDEAIMRRGRTSRSVAALEHVRYPRSSSGSVHDPSPVPSSPSSPVPRESPAVSPRFGRPLQHQPQHPYQQSMRSSSMSSLGSLHLVSTILETSASGSLHVGNSWNMDYGSSMLGRTGSYTNDASTSSPFFNAVDLSMGTNSPSTSISGWTSPAPMTGSGSTDHSNFLAMLGGEPLSNAPFLPGSFDTYSYGSESQDHSRSPPPAMHRPSFSESYVHGIASPAMSPTAVYATAEGVNGPVQNPAIPMDLSEDDLAVLSQFWDQSFGGAPGRAI